MTVGSKAQVCHGKCRQNNGWIRKEKFNEKQTWTYCF